MESPMSRYLKEALDFAKRMEILANEGDVQCNDDRCAVVFGVMRDSAYRIRSQARQELLRIQGAGVWDKV